ncbi:MAG TPA: amidase [Dehalococcoidia bacterium]|nr:amidase [Dehalococcoidia bacterium]
MVKLEELAFLDATAQAELVRRKEVTAAELVDAAIDRIERLNPVLNAVVTPLYEEARAAVAGKQLKGPFAGVPFLIKDIVASCAGAPMTFGSSFLRDMVSPRDSELVQRLKRAGLVILGKTNTSELGLLPTTEPRLFGPTRNPWDTRRTAGGSSGGSAAAVAAGMVPMAHANDGGGSIRIPASCCGVFGLKPTRARNPLGPSFGDMMSGLVVEHAVTRTVRDSAALLDATSGPDLGDPYWAPSPKRSFVKEVGVSPGRLRIAFTTKAATGVAVHSDCVNAVLETVALCIDLEHEVSEAAPQVDGEMVSRAFMTIWSAGCAWTIDSAATALKRKPEPAQFEPSTWVMYEIGRRQSAVTYLQAVTALQRVARDVARFFVDYDIWLTPTLAEPPLLLGEFDSPPEDPLWAQRRAASFCPFTPICNITGQPAMSVPLYWNGNGLPIGAHFIARFGDEATLFRLAAQLEAVRPWADYRPPVAA